MQHAEVFHNAPNEHVYNTDRYSRQANVTNILHELYEYAQPKSYIIGSAQSVSVDNPFNTPAQYKIYFLNIPDSAAIITLQVDTNDKAPIPSATPISAYVGYAFNGPVAANTNIGEWLDFEQNVMLKFSGTFPTQETIIIGFRRRKDLFIPTNVTPFNDPSM